MDYLMLAALTGNALINGLIWLIVVGLVAWLLWWLISYVGLPEPFNKIARVLVAVVAVILIIRFLLKITGTDI